MTGQITFPQGRSAASAGLGQFAKYMEVLSDPAKAKQFADDIASQLVELDKATKKYNDAVKIAATIEKSDEFYKTTVERSSKMLSDSEAKIAEHNSSIALTRKKLSEDLAKSNADLADKQRAIDKSIQANQEIEERISAKQKGLDTSEVRIEKSKKKLEEDRAELKANLKKWDSFREGISS